MPEREAFAAAAGYADAVERAATALEYRIARVEADLSDDPRLARGGVAAVLREGLENDKKALAVLRGAPRPHTGESSNPARTEKD